MSGGDPDEPFGRPTCACFTAPVVYLTDHAVPIEPLQFVRARDRRDGGGRGAASWEGTGAGRSFAPQSPFTRIQNHIQMCPLWLLPDRLQSP